MAERWSFIILRNIVLIGFRTFNEIADGAPGLSRGLLSKRWRDLERAGVIEIRPKPDGPGSTYEPTQAGREHPATVRTRVQTLHFLCGPGEATIEAARVPSGQRNEA